MIKLVISGLFILLAGFRPCHIKKIWLFSKTQYSGNIPKSAAGQPSRGYTQRLIVYIEISKTDESPQWQSVYINDEKHVVNMLPVGADSVQMGPAKNSRVPIVLKAASGNKLVLLEVAANENINITSQITFELEGLLNKKQVHFKSNEPVVELSPALMP